MLMRALTYATVFVGLVLIFLPAQLLSWSGVTRPEFVRTPQLIGMSLGIAGAALALWCVLAFAVVGKGTPAPFDPPRKLVIRGPYRFARNPMYIGAGFALLGAAIYFESAALVVFVGIFFLATHLFVVFYEERTLHQMFGEEYDNYRREVRRWWPRL